MQELFQVAGRIHISADDKTRNILSGIMPGKFECLFCVWTPSDGVQQLDGTYKQPSAKRSKEQHASMLAKLRAPPYNGDAVAGSKHCQGVEQEPLVLFRESFQETFPVESLHALLGGFRKLHTNALKPLSSDQVEAHLAALVELGIEAVKYFGAQASYEGRDVHVILANLDDVDLRYAENDGAFQLLHYLRRVVDACFGVKRHADYRRHIDAFRDACMREKVSFAWKIHQIVDHIPEQLEDFEEEGDAGMAIVSQQAGESCHRTFLGDWAVIKAAPEKRTYGKRLKSAVVTFNYLNFARRPTGRSIQSVLQVNSGE